jgi:ABC-2 type transport system permease protein
MSATVNMPASRLWAAYFGEIRFEFIKALRTPQFAVPTLFFPIMFYALFALALGGRGNGGSLASFANYGVFGCMGPGLFGFGVALAIEREMGLLTLKQALPSPAGSYLIARAVMAMLFVSLITLMLMTLAVLFAHVPLTPGQAVQVLAVNALGTLPFCAIGMFVGSLVSGQAAVAICNLIFLPMSFLSGLWFPLQMLPKFLVDIAPTWPAYHLVAAGAARRGRAERGQPRRPCAGARADHGGVLLFRHAPLSERRLQVVRRSPRRTLVMVGGAGAIVVALLFSGVFGGKPARKEDATAATDAASAAADTPALPVGVAAPATAVIADFDRGTEAAAYGVGWAAVGDEMRGGNSRATQRLVEGGAAGSKGALEVTGEVGNAIQYPFAGTMFFPEGPPMQGLMDFSAKKTLTFQARGDGRHYMLMVISGLQMDAIPLMVDFEAGADWHEVRLDLANFGAADFKRVRAIGVGTMGEGRFHFEIDDVRLE